MVVQDPSAKNGRTRLTLIVVAYHRPDALERLLKSTAGQPCRVVVVNVEDDPAVAEKAAAWDARVVPLLSNPGYAAAVNSGVAVVTTPLVAFANDDLELAVDCLERLMAELDAGAHVAVPRLRRPDGAVEASIARLVTPAALAGEWVALPDTRPRFVPEAVAARVRVEKWRRPEVAEAVGAVEAALVATTTALLSSRPLPEVYFLYWEEHEWFHLLRRNGCRVVYVPTAQAMHAGWAELNASKSRLLARNAVRCLARTQGPLAAALGWPVVIVWWFRRWLLELFRAAIRPTDAARSRLDAQVAGLKAALGSYQEIWPRPPGNDTERWP